MGSQASRIRTILLFAARSLAVALLLLPLAKVFALHSSFFDLGVFENTFYRIGIISEWQVAFAGHAHGFALAYGWLYGLFPFAVGPYFLVGTQAALLVLPAILLYRRFGLFVAFVYVAFYPLWVNAHFDFHFDHLAVPLLMGFYLALLDRRVGWAVLSATLLIFVKEPFALQTAACGVLMLWAAFRGSLIWVQPLDQINRRWLVVGAMWLLSVGIGYFYFSMQYLLPYFSPGDWARALGGVAYSWLGHGMPEVLRTIITKPHIVVWDIISTPGKLVYLGVVFGLLAFVPLLRPVFLIPAIPLLIIAMLSHLPNYYDYNTHYTAGLIVPVIFAFVHGLPRAEKIWERLVIRIRGMAMLQCLSTSLSLSIIDHRRRIFYVLLFCWILLGHMMLSQSPISRLFWSDKVWSYSWQAYMPTERDAMIKLMIEKYIPSDPNISVTTQNTLNYSQLAYRNMYLPFPMGIEESSRVIDWSNRTFDGLVEFVMTGYKPPAITYYRYSDYVVLDLKRPYFLIDRGCEWVYGECRNKEMERKFLGWVSYTRSIYDTVFEQDGFMILRRRGV